jgi:hypothetical protein
MKLVEWQIVKMTSIASPDRGRLLAWLEAQAGAVSTIGDGRDEQALRAQPQPGRWSALQHLAHLGRMHEVYLARVRRLLSEDAPAIAAYRAEHDDEWNQWEGLTLIELLRSLSNDQWHRIGRHSNFGSLTLAQWIEFFLVHEGHHLYSALTLARAGRG